MLAVLLEETGKNLADLGFNTRRQLADLKRVEVEHAIELLLLNPPDTPGTELDL